MTNQTEIPRINRGIVRRKKRSEKIEDRCLKRMSREKHDAMNELIDRNDDVIVKTSYFKKDDFLYN